jgi:hypothetical protein
MEKDIKRVKRKNLADIAGDKPVKDSKSFISYASEIDFNRRVAVYLAGMAGNDIYGGKR